MLKITFLWTIFLSLTYGYEVSTVVGEVGQNLDYQFMVEFSDENSTIESIVSNFNKLNERKYDWQAKVRQNFNWTKVRDRRYIYNVSFKSLRESDAGIYSIRTVFNPKINTTKYFLVVVMKTVKVLEGDSARIQFTLPDTDHNLSTLDFALIKPVPSGLKNRIKLHKINERVYEIIVKDYVLTMEAVYTLEVKERISGRVVYKFLAKIDNLREYIDFSTKQGEQFNMRIKLLDKKLNVTAVHIKKLYEETSWNKTVPCRFSRDALHTYIHFEIKDGGNFGQQDVGAYMVSLPNGTRLFMLRFNFTFSYEVQTVRSGTDLTITYQLPAINLATLGLMARWYMISTIDVSYSEKQNGTHCTLTVFEFASDNVVTFGLNLIDREGRYAYSYQEKYKTI